jgi:hypothetical protein
LEVLAKRFLDSYFIDDSGLNGKIRVISWAQAGITITEIFYVKKTNPR